MIGSTIRARLAAVIGLAVASVLGAGNAEPAKNAAPAEARSPPEQRLDVADVDAGLDYPATVELHPEQHVVRLRQKQRLIAVGALLESGRVLSSLTAIGNGRDLTAQFADGGEAELRVHRTHRGFDLALLLVPNTEARGGLELSTRMQYERALSWRGARRGADPFGVHGKVRALGADGIEVDVVLSRREWPLGTPIVDADGRLSAIAVLSCVPQRAEPESDRCTERTVGLPARWIGKFLESAGEGDSEGWLGVRAEAVDIGWVRGLRILSVEVGSPAERAGLKSTQLDLEGDLLVAMNGVPLGTPRRLGRMVAAQLPGTTVDLLILREGRFDHVDVKLGGQPRSRKAWQLNPPLIQPPNPWLGF